MIATALYTVVAMLLVFATSHIIAAAIAAPSATPAEATTPDATVPSANKANPSLLKAEAAADAAAQNPIGFVVGLLFLFVLAALFSVGVVLAYTGAARALIAAALLTSALLGLTWGMRDGKRRNKESVKGTMNMYIRAYFIALFIYAITRRLYEIIS